MKRWPFRVFAVLLSVGFPVYATGQSGLAETIQERPKAPEGALVEATPAPAPTIDPDAALRAKISQLMIIALEGSNNTTTGDRFVLERYTPGGVVMVHLTQPSDAVMYIQEVRGIAEPRGLPLFVGTDLYSLVTQERNPKSTFVQLPSPLSVAAADHPPSVSNVAGMLASNLAAMGFNMHIGPSLELTSTLADVEGSIYRFGSDPELTATAGSTIVTTLAQGGVLTMPMGFPGGGANRRDGGPAVLLTPPSVLGEQDLRPFIAAIGAGASLILVTPTLAPMLDSANVPSCVSESVMRGLLREQLHYDGIIVAGPMDSSDIAHEYDPAEAALLALNAGADMLYWTSSRQAMVRAVDFLVQAARDGTLPETRIDDAYARVERVKTQQREQAKAAPKPKQAEKLERDRKLPEATYQVERYSVTLVQNRGNILPLNKDDDMPIGVTGILGVDELHEALEKYIKPVSQQAITTAMHAGRIHSFEIDRITRHIRGLKTMVVVLSDAISTPSQVELVKALQAQGVRVVIVLVGYPRGLDALAGADAIMVTYADANVYAESLRAVADALVGMAPINIYHALRPLRTQVGKAERFNVFDLIRTPSGRLPVSIGPFQSGMSVSYDSAPNLKRVQWDFGDGQRSKDAETEHSYAKPGSYDVTLTVTIRGGEAMSQRFNVIVE